jgi:hypothetical protein
MSENLFTPVRVLVDVQSGNDQSENDALIACINQVVGRAADVVTDFVEVYAEAAAERNWTKATATVRKSNFKKVLESCRLNPEWKAAIAEEKANLQRAYKIVKDLEKALNAPEASDDDSDDTVDVEAVETDSQAVPLIEMSAADYMRKTIEAAIKAADECGRNDLVDALQIVLAEV